MSYNIGSKESSERSGGVEYISPMVDVIFKKMFSQEENKDMLRGLVRAFLNVDIGNDFKIAGNDLPPENPDEKFSRIDLHASSNVGEVDIEVQVGVDPNFVQRFVNYTMQLYLSSVKRGDEIYEPRPVFGLGICGNNVLPHSEEWFSEHKIMGTESHLPLVDNFKVCFAELSKLRTILPERYDIDLKDERIAWAVFFRCRKEEQFDMLKEHTSIPEVKKAVNVLGNFSTDPEMQELARRRLNNEIYKQSVISAAKAEGKAEGRAEGIVIGEARGEAKRDAEITANLKAMGMSEEQIKLALTGQSAVSKEPQAQNKSSQKHGRR